VPGSPITKILNLYSRGLSEDVEARGRAGGDKGLIGGDGGRAGGDEGLIGGDGGRAGDDEGLTGDDGGRAGGINVLLR
jgi:hypothetical protein